MRDCQEKTIAISYEVRYLSKLSSRITQVIALRLPNEVVAIITRRAEKQSIKPSEWLRNRITYDTKRKHGGRNET